MRETITFFVEGDPKGQPRSRACIRGKHAGVYDPGTADAWKMAVAEVWRNVAKRDTYGPFETAVSVRLVFYFRRPKGHYRTGKNAGILRDGLSVFHTGKPDLDNLAKAVLDVLTRLGAWKDDALVNQMIVERLWAREGHNSAGCQITISER